MRILLASLALLGLVGSASAQSTINPANPAQGAPLSSAPVRSNFAAAYSDINGLLGMHSRPNLAACQSNPTVGTDCLTIGSPTAFGWYKYTGTNGYALVGTFDPTASPPTFAASLSGGSIVTNPPLTSSFSSGVATLGFNYDTNFAVPGSTLALNNCNANTVLAGPSFGSASEPGCRALVGADLPSPGVSSLGGIKSYSAPSHQWINSISTGGAALSTQPGFADISGLGTMAEQNAGAVVITGGSITGLPTPSAASDAATKQYVDSSVVGLVVHPAVALATTAALPANTYNNGSSGVGATLTANANGDLVIDGTTNPVAGTRIIVKNESAAANNGIYTVTTTGGVSQSYVLTRAADANTPGTGNPAEIGFGSYALVTGGTANANSGWSVNLVVTTIGTSAIAWVQFSSSTTGVTSLGGLSGVISLGTGLTVGGSTINTPWTNSGGNIYNNNAGGVNIGSSAAPNMLLSVGNVWGADASGRPYCDVRAEGAVQDGSTDDTASFTACKTICNTYTVAGTGCAIFVDPSTNVTCLKSTFVVPANVRLFGPALGTSLSSCGSGLTPVEINGSQAEIENLTILGPGMDGETGFGATAGQAGFIVGPSCIDCKINFIQVLGGAPTVLWESGEAHAYTLIAAYSYGGVSYGPAAIFEATTTNGNVAAGTIEKLKPDQGYPIVTPACCQTYATRTNTPTSYATNQVVDATCQDTNGYWLQAVSGGTSGSSSLTCKNYGQNFTDGGVTWTLVSPDQYYHLLFESNTFEFQISKCDTGGGAAGIGMFNDLAGGSAPSSIRLTDCNGGSGYQTNFRGHDGSLVELVNFHFGGCIVTGCSNFIFQNNFTGSVSIWGGINEGAPLAGSINAGNGYSISGINNFSGDTAGIVLNNSVDHVVITGNVQCNALSGGCVNNASSGSHITTSPNQ